MYYLLTYLLQTGFLALDHAISNLSRAAHILFAVLGVFVLFPHKWHVITDFTEAGSVHDTTA